MLVIAIVNNITMAIGGNWVVLWERKVFVLAEKYDRAVIGERIRRLRKSQGLTVQELKEKSGVSTGYISEVERGLPAVSVDKLSQIAEALRVGLDTLLGDTPDEQLPQVVIEIPASLSEAADRLDLTFRQTLTLLQGQQSLTARRADSDPAKWNVDRWVSFYERVKDYLEQT